MNPNPTRTLWISIGAACLAMILIYSYSQEKKAEYDKRYGTMKRVVIATKDILEMSTIDATMLSIEEKPVDFIQPEAIVNPEDVEGMVAAAPIKKGEQILGTKVLKPGPNTGLSLQVAPNKRAVTIPIDEVRGVSKLIRPGDRVDILTSVESGKGQTSRREVKTLLQDVIILATGVQVTNNIPRKLESDSGGKLSFRNLNGDTTFSAVTLEVSPKDAQNLIFIMSASPGSIYLTLRNPNDRAVTNFQTATVDSVLGRADTGISVEPARVPASFVMPQAAPKPLPPKRKPGPFQEIK